MEISKTTIIHIVALILAAGAAVSANAQLAEELSTQCSALKTAKKGNAILVKQLAAEMDKAEQDEDFERVAELMAASAELAVAESGFFFMSMMCRTPAEKEAARQRQEKENAAAVDPAATENLASSNCRALIEAASKGQFEVVKGLLLKGANPFAENEYGINAIEAARINGDHDIWRELYNADGKRGEVCK